LLDAEFSMLTRKTHFLLP